MALRGGAAACLQLPRFAGKIVNIDSAIADRWGRIAAVAKQAGTPLAAIDGLLAATAIHYRLTIVSRNISDFAVTQVPIVNPWIR